MIIYLYHGSISASQTMNSAWRNVCDFMCGNIYIYDTTSDREGIWFGHEYRSKINITLTNFWKLNHLLRSHSLRKERKCLEPSQVFTITFSTYFITDLSFHFWMEFGDISGVFPPYCYFTFNILLKWWW